MSRSTHPEGVPLNIWPLPAAGGDGTALRRHLAAQAIDAYTPPDGLVVDVLPGSGDGIAAAVELRRNLVALPTDLGPRGFRRAEVERLSGEADLVLALVPEDRLVRRRPWAPTACAARAVARDCNVVLRTTGRLVVAVVGNPGGRRDDVSATVEVVTGEGLVYFQHVVALLGDDLDAGVAHADVLVFERRAS